MQIDRGFHVTNFVGTYSIIDDPEVEGHKLIISKEVNHADRDSGEIPLAKKCIFDYDNAKNKYISLELANVDVTDDNSIIQFCNKYGLPFSSQTAYDRELGVGPDIADDLAIMLSKREARDTYERYDTMDRLEFCRHAVHVRNLIALKTLLSEQKFSARTPAKLLPILTYLVFYSQEFWFAYTEEEAKERRRNIPKTRLANLQYDFQFFRRVNDAFMHAMSPAEQIICFISRFKYQRNHPDNVKNPTILCDISSENNLRMVNLFERIFLEEPVQTDSVVCSPFLIYEVDKKSNSVTAKIYTKNIQNVRNKFTVDEYGNIVYPEEIVYSGDISELVCLGFEVLRDVVNEGLAHISPELVLDSQRLRGGWELKYQLEGTYMEVFSQLAANAQYRLCQNPKCGNYFLASRSRSTKVYCCDACSAADRQRRRRARKKEESDTLET